MTPPIAFDDPLNQRAAEVEIASNAYLKAVISGDPVRIEAAFKAWLTVAGIPTWKDQSPMTRKKEFMDRLRKRVLERLVERIDRAYARRGIPKRTFTTDQTKNRVTDQERVCPACNRPFRGHRELCRTCRRKDEKQ